jgi:hypothetical protein
MRHRMLLSAMVYQECEKVSPARSADLHVQPKIWKRLRGTRCKNRDRVPKPDMILSHFFKYMYYFVWCQ